MKHFDYSILIKTNIIAACSKMCYVSIKLGGVFSIFVWFVGRGGWRLARTYVTGLDRLRQGASYIDFIVIRLCSILRCLVIRRGGFGAAAVSLSFQKLGGKGSAFVCLLRFCCFSVCVSLFPYIKGEYIFVSFCNSLAL